jgi:carboxymethylenebutenolidase
VFKNRYWFVAGFIFMGLLAVLVFAGCGLLISPPSCEDIVYYSDNEPVEAVLCLPAEPQENLPAVVFLHGIGAFEPWDPDVEDSMGYTINRELAEHGYATLSILYFSRTPPPPGPLPNTFQGVSYLALVEARPTWISSIEDGLSYMQSRPEVDPDRIGLIGYSLGGSLALGLDQNRNDYASLISISGFVWNDQELENLTAGDAPTLILQAEADDMVDMGEANRIKNALEAHGIEYELIVIDEADHRWMGQEGDQGFDAILEFLESYLNPSGP